MNEERLKSIIEKEIDWAIVPSELSDNRANALDYFNGEPRGDEIEGRSKIVSTDVADTIEWIRPQVIEAFVASDEVVKFDPVGEEDEEQAEQESDYINYVITKENNAFLLFDEWTQDALLQKNGYAKAYREEKEVKRTETYQSVDVFALGELTNSDDVEIVQATEIQPGIYTVVVEITTPQNQTKIEVIPPEEARINPDHNSIDLTNCRFFAHETFVPAADLITDGFDKKVVDQLPAYEDEDSDEEDISRNQFDSEREYVDHAMRKIRVYECYLRADIEETGDVKLYQVYYAGKKVLDWEEIDFLPIAAITPRVMAHQHHGKSIYDRLKTIQDIKTAVWRQILDNLYLLNNQRTYVNTKAGVNFNDLLTNRPGGIVRGERPAQEAISPIPTMPIGSDAYNVLEKLDQQRTEKAGVGPDTMGQNQNLSNDTYAGLERLMSAKEKLVGLIIRTFAETGVNALFNIVRAIESKYQDREKVVKLRGNWVNVNPSEWRERFNTTIRVGLGTGDKMRQQGALMQIMNLQEKLVTGGAVGTLITPKHIYETLQDYVKAADLKTGTQYFLDPDSEEARQLASQPKPPDPAQEMMKLQAQIEQAKIELDREKLQLDREKAVIDAQKGQSKEQSEIALKQVELQQKEQETVLKTQKESSELDIKRGELALKEKDLALKARDSELKHLKDRQDAEISMLQSNLDSMGTVMEAIKNDRERTRSAIFEHFKGNPRLESLISQLTGE